MISTDKTACFLDRRRFGTVLLGGAATSLLPGCTTSLTSSLTEAAPVPASAAPNDGLVRAAPETVGVRSQAILDFLHDVEADGLEMHSFMLAREGQVISEGWWWPYLPGRIHMTHSLTKSVTATAVGLAIGEGRFGLDDPVVSFFPEFVPADASHNLKTMTVRDLLTMRTGHANETSGSLWRPIPTSWVAEFMKIPVPYEPGTKWVYTSAASFMLSAIVTRTTGQTMEAYLQPRMLDPMGIDRLHWDLSPGGINPGGNGLSWPTSASLKLGMLHAQKGKWNGQQILSPDWIQAATSAQVPEGPYGYQWWIGPGDAYYALGLFTQLAVVFPEHNATLAVFAAIDGSSKLLPHIWKHFPAAFEAASLPVGPERVALARRTNNLRLLPQLRGTRSPIEGRISGRSFEVLPNDQGVNRVAFDVLPDRIRYTMSDKRGTHTVVNGTREWLEQETSMSGARLHHEYELANAPVVAGARWVDETTLEMVWQYVEAAFRDTVTCHFDRDKVSVKRSVNVNSAETSLPTLTGVMGEA